MDMQDYLDFVYILTVLKPRTLLEYGSGYSTHFIKQFIEVYNLPTKFKSFECDSNYYDFLMQPIFGLQDTIEHCSIVCTKSPIEGQSTCRYVHSLEGLEEVDFVIIDGPGYTGYDGCDCDINQNVEWLQESTGNSIGIWVDERKHQMKYYYQLGMSNQVINFKL